VWWLVGRALATVDGLREEVATITAESLHRRVIVPPVADEVGRLAITMNAMLDRIEQNDRVQRTFVADASHELKSPLAAAQTELEIGLAHADSTDWPDSARSVLGDIERVRRIVDDLLTLARLDEGAPFIRRPVDVDDLILDEVVRLRRTSSVVIDSTGVSAGRVDGDYEQLRRVVRNLLDNAVAHAVRTVVVELETTDVAIRFRVHDDGSGIAIADRARVFERFARLDEDRTRSRGGSGLGLAIVADVVRAHDGRVAIVDEGLGTTFEVTLPRSS
jgi:signal transduction histidine kinase